MAIIKIDTDFCYECGAPKEEMHHIIPRSKGGKKTIPLCIDCHGKAHDISNRRLFLDAAKEGRKKFVENGGKLGRKTGSIKDNDKMFLEHDDIVKSILIGNSIRKTMALTNKSSGTVQKVKKIMENKNII
jgi:hypothetical protein